MSEWGWMMLSLYLVLCVDIGREKDIYILSLFLYCSCSFIPIRSRFSHFLSFFSPFYVCNSYPPLFSLVGFFLLGYISSKNKIKEWGWTRRSHGGKQTKREREWVKPPPPPLALCVCVCVCFTPPITRAEAHLCKAGLGIWSLDEKHERDLTPAIPRLNEQSNVCDGNKPGTRSK